MVAKALILTLSGSVAAPNPAQGSPFGPERRQRGHLKSVRPLFVYSLSVPKWIALGLQ